MRRSALAATLCLAAAAGSERALSQPERSTTRPAGATVVRNARIVTVSGPVIERGSLLVVDGKIAALGAEVTPPAGAAVVDAKGEVLYPGLIDALTTLGLTEIGSVRGSVDTTETGDVNAHARAWIAVHPHSELIPVARANGLTAALAAPQGGLVSGQSALIRLAGDTPEELVVKQPAAMHAVFPSGRPAFEIAQLFQEPELKTFEERVKEKKKNQEKALRRLSDLLAGARAWGEALKGTRPGGAPRETNLVEEALAPVARGELPLVMRADEEEDIRASVRFAAERKLRLVVAGGLDAWRCAEVLKSHDVPVLVSVDRLPRREADPYDAAYANPGALYRAGVRFAIVSDDASQARNLPYEAAMARAFGLPAEAALRAITLAPAEIFGVADRMGSLDVGKEANFFLATGDIMDHRTQVTHVFVGGRAQSLETRHTRLWKEFRDRP